MARTNKDAPRFVATVKKGKPKNRRLRPVDDIDRGDLPIDEETVTSNKVLVAMSQAFHAIERAFEVMNWYASDAVYDAPRGDGDPNAVLGEVYSRLAPAHQLLSEVLMSPEGRAFDVAESALRRLVADDLIKEHERQRKEMTARYNMRMQELRKERREIANMNARHCDRAARLRGELEREFDARVEARVLEITSGVPNTGSGRKVFL